MTTSQTQTPVPRGRTPIARAAPSPDSLDSAEKERQRDCVFFVLFSYEVEEQQHRREYEKWNGASVVGLAEW